MKKRFLSLLLLLPAIFATGCTSFISSILSDDTTEYLPDGLQEIVDISPDDSTLLFSYKINDIASIYTADVDGKNIKQLTKPKKGEAHLYPRYSPDGKKILFISSSDEQRRSPLMIMDHDGSNIKQLTDDDEMIQEAIFSPNGNRIYFIKATEYAELPLLAGLYGPINLNIFSMNTDGTGEKQLTDFQKGELYNLIVSEDESQIKFIKKDDDEPYSNQLYTIEMNQPKDINKINLSKEFIVNVDISSMDDSIAIAAVAKEIFSDSEIFLVDPETNETVQITSLQSDTSHPRFFHKKKKLLFMEIIQSDPDKYPPQHQLWSIDLQSRKLDKVKLF
ncbi:TolB family protein [Desmospora activa]|uniref:TolB protein n=1 Tax=Desmospora activa DSM 45169 TaxID=1121389 RepID=A0A2T4ZD22_9BACL|nr:PD40 domain-containing protein [Desmospora activa]PTM59791.1 TolB protein [Desmospora activa DSM 45169]